jgi:hypothetical protein
VNARIDPDNKDVVNAILGAVPISPGSIQMRRRGLSDSHLRNRAIVLTQEMIKAKTIDPARAVKPFISAIGDLACRIR